VVVLAVPYVFASVIADALRARGTYEVLAPDLRVDELPAGHFDAAITSMPVSMDIADVLIELPDSFEHPVKITTRELSVHVAVHLDRPIEDALDTLDQYLFGPEHERSLPVDPA
jgi:hypothetical protein